MRILTLNYEYPPIGGGSSPFSLGLAGELARRGHRVDVLTSRIAGSPSTEGANPRVHRVPTLRRHLGYSNALEMMTYVASAAFHLRRSVDAYDLIHAHFLIPTGLVLLTLPSALQVPVVLTAHGSDVPGYDPEPCVALSHGLVRPLWRRVVERCHRIVCPSTYLQLLLLRHAPNARSTVIPYGMEIRPEAHALRRRKILVVSRFFRRKGIDIFLRSLADIDRTWTVDVLGDGPEREALKRQAADLPADIRFWGWIDRKSAEYRRFFSEASIFVFLSSSENFPIVLMDAMESGLAVLASDIPGNREVLGDSAAYVNPVTPDAVAASLRALIADEAYRERLGRQGRQRLASTLTWDHIGSRYEELFLQSVGKAS